MKADRPRCKCHDLPMVKNGHYADGSQRWECSNRVRLKYRFSRARYHGQNT